MVMLGKLSRWAAMVSCRMMLLPLMCNLGLKRLVMWHSWRTTLTTLSCSHQERAIVLSWLTLAPSVTEFP
eukprot:1467192-Karenia_brevis.AAC.1